MQMDRRNFLECIGAGAVAAVFTSSKLVSQRQIPTRFEIEYFLDGKSLGIRDIGEYPTHEMIPPGKTVIEQVRIYRRGTSEVRERKVGRDIYGNFLN